MLSCLPPPPLSLPSVQLCPTLCNPMDCSTQGLPVHLQLPEFTQTHVHRVGEAIQTSHPLSSPSLPAFNLSQHQGLFQWVSSLYQVAKVLAFQFQHQSFQWIFRTDFLGLVGSPCSPRDFQDCFPLELTGWISLLSKGLSGVFSNIPVQKHEFLGAQLSLWSNSHSIHDYWKNHSLD